MLLKGVELLGSLNKGLGAILSALFADEDESFIAMLLPAANGFSCANRPWRS